MTESVVLHELDARGIATVTLNRPERGNAYDGEMIAALLELVPRLADDPAVRIVVLRGSGRHFQAGADLRWIDAVRTQSRAENLLVSKRTAEAVRGLNELPKPTIALVHGGCFGGGVGVVAACDVVIAESTAVFSITEARWGLVASIIIPQLNGAMGARQVRRYALSCERFDASRAHALGLVHEICEPGGLDAAAAPVIDNLLRSAPDALAATKRRTLRLAGQAVPTDVLESLVAEHAAKRTSSEALEGLASFREKREANWYPAK